MGTGISIGWDSEGSKCQGNLMEQLTQKLHYIVARNVRLYVIYLKLPQAVKF